MKSDRSNFNNIIFSQIMLHLRAHNTIKNNRLQNNNNICLHLFPNNFVCLYHIIYRIKVDNKRPKRLVYF